MKKPAPKPSERHAVTHVSDATLRKFVGYNMKRAFNVVQADLQKTLKPFELRMLTYSALVLVVDNPGLRQSQLADAIVIERPNLVVIIDELERRELIVRDRMPNDRRAYALKATLQGRQLCDKATTAVVALEEQLLVAIDEDARANLVAALKLIETNPTKG